MEKIDFVVLVAMVTSVHTLADMNGVTSLLDVVVLLTTAVMLILFMYMKWRERA